MPTDVRKQTRKSIYGLVWDGEAFLDTDIQFADKTLILLTGWRRIDVARYKVGPELELSI